MSVIDDALMAVPEPQKSELERIRKIIRRAAPGAVEVISYGIPAFKHKDKYVIGFAALKKHLSLFPTSRPIEVLKKKLRGYELSKGTIRFTVDRPLSESVIRELVAVRLKEIEAGRKPKVSK